jgi:SPP1 gp7 family putative phage head morphogenesis protein
MAQVAQSLRTIDAVRKTIRGNFKPSAAAEREFYRQLKKIAQASGHIIERHAEGATLHDMDSMQKELEAYSRKLGPWATRQAQKMLQSVANSNKRAYQEKSKAIGKALRSGMADTEVGMTAASLLFDQVDLIKSLPLDAGLRAQKIAFEAVLAGRRAFPDEDTIRELEDQMGMSTEVATTRAMLIARTETARSTAYINQSRAQSVGSLSYRWHNSGDGAVRESHRFYKGQRLQGMIFQWANPPTLDDGMTGHPGTFPNCRCFAEPVFAEE